MTWRPSASPYHLVPPCAAFAQVMGLEKPSSDLPIVNKSVTGPTGPMRKHSAEGCSASCAASFAFPQPVAGVARDNLVPDACYRAWPFGHSPGLWHGELRAGVGMRGTISRRSSTRRRPPTPVRSWPPALAEPVPDVYGRAWKPAAGDEHGASAARDGGRPARLMPALSCARRRAGMVACRGATMAGADLVAILD